MNTKIFLQAALAVAVAGTFTSCNDYLDKEPLSQITPENYFTQESHLESYANGRYTQILPSSGNWSYGTYGGDLDTDNMVSLNYNDIYIPGKWLTPMNDDTYRDHFRRINDVNYFFDQVMPKYEANLIEGNENNIRHYIGEMYFMRAYAYFRALQDYGDFPIIKSCLSDNMEQLTEASRRYPCNEVARFILSDLDNAYEYMKGVNMATTRVNADLALLIKSRVALYEGTWLKNFAGTPFVPNGEGWPGATKEYNSGYQYPAGSLENEYKWFLQQAIDAADQVASKAQLVQNTGVVPQTEGSTIAALEAENPWLAMFGTLDLSGNPEVMLWRQYSRGLGVTHNIVVYAQKGNRACGTTRGLVDCFTMADGTPIYASSDYKGDLTLSDVRQGRDPRLFVLLKEPGQKNILVDDGVGTHGVAVEETPKILESNVENVYSTGYALRKGNYYGSSMAGNGDNYTACPVFRSVEALLNYIEAYYELNGTLDAKANDYWTKIRARHTGMSTDFMHTVNATDMTQEAKGDWGAYTAGQVIDPMRYNIRRERRCELIAESFRWMDLKRWRSFDQLISNRYHIEGFHIWNSPMTDWYDLKALQATISSPERSEYLRPFEAKMNDAFNGLSWSMAHYLRPIPIYQMMLTAPDYTTASQSIIYQNPYWPVEPNMPADR